MGFIFATFLIFRILLFFIASTGGKILPFSPRFPYSDVYLIPSGLPHWFWSFANFDGVHYLTIAKYGYSAQFTQVFFPLYPILIRILEVLFPYAGPVMIGLFISNLFFFLSLMLFRKLLDIDYKNSLVRLMIIYIVFFPTSFYFGSLYTESLFLSLTLSSFYFARKKRWWLAGISGGLASATRLAGIFLLPALLWEWYESEIKNQKSKIKITIQNSKFSKYYIGFLHFAFCILHSPVLYLVPLGLIAYMLYLQLTFGDFLYFWHVQPVFGAQRSGGSFIMLPQVIWRYSKMFSILKPLSETFMIVFFEFIFTFSSFILLIYAHIKKVRLSYLIFSWLTLFTPTLTGTFSSMPRYVLTAFPIFISLGLISNRIVKTILFFSFITISIFFVILFTAGHWVS